jgi:hypothetical protein
LKIDFSAASILVQEKVNAIQSSLNKGNAVEFGQIGRFHIDEEGILRFEQNRYFNFLLSAYGLKQMVVFVPHTTVKEVVAPIVEAEKTQEFSEAIIRDIRPNNHFKAVLKYAAAAVIVLPLAFYSFWIPTQTPALESKMMSWKDFNPFQTTQEVSYKKETISLPSTIYTQPDVPTTEVAVENEVPNKVEEVVAITSTPANVTRNLHFIVGCFSSQENANNLVSTLQSKGFRAQIVPGGTLIRVSAGAAQNEQELVQLTQQANAAGLTGWVLK